MPQQRPGFVLSLLELGGVVFLRFRAVPRAWNVWLVAVNATCIVFIDRLEAQVVLATTALAVSIMALAYQRIGFTRILGTAHLLWVPMFAWMATRLETIQNDPPLSTWLAVLLATNTVSLIIDVTDAVRFLRGERAPHYVW